MLPQKKTNKLQKKSERILKDFQNRFLFFNFVTIFFFFLKSTSFRYIQLQCSIIVTEIVVATSDTIFIFSFLAMKASEWWSARQKCRLLNTALKIFVILLYWKYNQISVGNLWIILIIFWSEYRVLLMYYWAQTNYEIFTWRNQYF